MLVGAVHNRECAMAAASTQHCRGGSYPRWYESLFAGMAGSYRWYGAYLLGRFMTANAQWPQHRHSTVGAGHARDDTKVYSPAWPAPTGGTVHICWGGL